MFMFIFLSHLTSRGVRDKSIKYSDKENARKGESKRYNGGDIERERRKNRLRKRVIVTVYNREKIKIKYLKFYIS